MSLRARGTMRSCLPALSRSRGRFPVFRRQNVVEASLPGCPSNVQSRPSAIDFTSFWYRRPGSDLIFSRRFPVRQGKKRGVTDAPPGFERHAAGARHQVELKCHSFGRAVIEGLGAHPGHAVAQPALQRAEALPFEAVDRMTRRVRLRDHRTGEKLAPIVVMALAARQVQLTLPAVEQLAAQIEERPQLAVAPHGDREPARLTSDKSGLREEVFALPGEWCRTLMLAAAPVDPSFEV